MHEREVLPESDFQTQWLRAFDVENNFVCPCNQPIMARK